jgi:hypothetical protein
MRSPSHLLKQSAVAIIVATSLVSLTPLNGYSDGIPARYDTHSHKTNYFIATSDVAGDAAIQRAATALGERPLHFEEDQGRGSRFIARAAGVELSISSTETVIHLRGGEQSTSRFRHATPTAIAGAPEPNAAPASRTRRETSVRMQLFGANSRARLSGESQLTSRSNYFIGSDPRRWRTDVPNYGRVKAARVYRGVDVIYYSSGNNFEYDFTLAPGADPKVLAMRFLGGHSVRIDKFGDLAIATAAGQLRQPKPVAYQLINGARREVAARYRLKSNRDVGFIIGYYDKHLPLVIDPVLSFSTFFGGDGDDVINGVALDAQGYVYVAGTTDSRDLPITPGTLPLPDDILPHSPVAFVAKFDLTNNVLVYSTYLGGSHALLGSFVLNECRALAVDLSGNTYVAGKTDAVNFPTTAGAFQSFLAGNNDAFVAKLNATGSALVYSTYLGSSKSSDSLPTFNNVALDEAVSIAVDRGGSAYVTGRTTGIDFPITPGAFKTTRSNDAILVGEIDPVLQVVADVFITKVNPTGTALVYSTYLGGRGEDSSSGVAVDDAGSAYVVGTTEARDFPTFNALQANMNSTRDAFVTKLSPDGGRLLYSTYLGGCGRDEGNAISLDESGSAYVAGTTLSSDLPTTAGVFQPATADVNLFKSTNGGISWIASNVGIPSDASISQVVIDPANPSNLYASAFNVVFNSTDSGRTWDDPSNHTDADTSVRPTKVLAFDPKKPSTIYAVRQFFFQAHLLKSLNGGRTWEVANSNFPLPVPLQDIFSLTIDPANTSTWYAFISQGLFKTTDGVNWTKRDKGLFDEASFLYSLAIAPGNSARLLASVGAKLFKSNNGGKKWDTTSLGDAFVLSVTFDSTTPSTAYASGAGLFKSTDSGDSWMEIETDLPDIGSIVIDPTNPSVLYTTTLTGIFKSTDGGRHWSAIHNGLRTNASFPPGLISSLAIDPRDAATLYAAGFGSGPESFVAKLDPSGASFAYLTYLGGTGSEIATGIAVDGVGNAHVTGHTGSEDFPIWKAFQPDKHFPGNDVFVTRLNGDAAGLAYSTYIGGSDLDVSSAIAVDSFGNAYIAGLTFSVDFPLANPMQSSFLTTEAQAFLARIADADSSLPPPVILSVSPQAGASTGQYTITLNGANFRSGARVRLGGVPATLVEVTSNRITATVPARPAGVVNVVVSNPDGQSAVLTKGFTYLPIPEIVAAEIEDKVLEVAARNVDRGAVILLDGVAQKTQQRLSSGSSQILTSKKAVKKIARGQRVTIQVRNANGFESAPFSYTRPVN